MILTETTPFHDWIFNVDSPEHWDWPNETEPRKTDIYYPDIWGSGHYDVPITVRLQSTEVMLSAESHGYAVSMRNSTTVQLDWME